MEFLKVVLSCAIAAVLLCILGAGVSAVVVPLVAVFDSGACIAWLLFCPLGTFVALLSVCGIVAIIDYWQWN